MAAGSPRPMRRGSSAVLFQAVGRDPLESRRSRARRPDVGRDAGGAGMTHDTVCQAGGATRTCGGEEPHRARTPLPANQAAGAATPLQLVDLELLVIVGV